MNQAKSFYIFDFDDNIIHTDSQTYLFHKETGEEIGLSSGDWISARHEVGKTGPYENYEVIDKPMGSYREYCDSPEHNHFPFLDDLKRVVQKDSWKGPSWQRFVKAVDRERTMSIITARGHHPLKIEEGLKWLHEAGHLPKLPQIHSIYAITHPETLELLRWTGPTLVSNMKKQALHHFIESVYNDFGHSAAHRFGFSDDDPSNIQSTRQKFMDLKERNPHHRFFLYHARPKEVVEEEVLLYQSETQ